MFESHCLGTQPARYIYPLAFATVSVASPKLALPFCPAWVAPTHGSSGTSLRPLTAGCGGGG